jgi:hypothetical protein
LRDGVRAKAKRFLATNADQTCSITWKVEEVKKLKKFLLIALAVIGLSVAATPSSEAGVSIGIGFGGPYPGYYPYGYPYYGPRVVVRRPWYWYRGHRVYYSRRPYWR